MNRDVSWQRIIIAVFIGCAVFAGGKLAYGFQISEYDVIGTAISLAVVVGLAALILVFRDKVTLKPNMSAEEREAAIAKRSKRLHRGWVTALFIMALVVLPVHAFGLIDELLWQRLVFFGLAALIVISFLSGRHDSDQGGLEMRNQQAKNRRRGMKDRKYRHYTHPTAETRDKTGIPLPDFVCTPAVSVLTSH